MIALWLSLVIAAAAVVALAVELVLAPVVEHEEPSQLDRWDGRG